MPTTTPEEPNKSPARRRDPSDPSTRPSWLTMKEGGLLQSDPLATAVFILCVLVGLVAWVAGSSEDRLRVPLLLGGLSAIVIFVIRRESSAVAFAAILIVGVLVAPRDYLLRIAHMIARPTAAFEDYAKRYDGEVADPAAVSKIITDRVADALKQQGFEVDANTRRAIGSVVSEAEADRIAEKVRRDSSEIPLRRVAEGGESFRTFVRDFGSSDYFRRDMEFLRAERLVEYPGTDLASAKITELGGQIVRRLQPLSSAFPTAASRLSREAMPPAETEMAAISVPESRQLEISGGQPAWLFFDVSQAGKYQILAQASDKTVDTALALFSAQSKAQIAYDDDGGGGVGGLDPKIERTIEPGRYYIRLEEVFAFDTKDITVTLSLRRVP